MVQACNVVEFNGNGTAAGNEIWSTQTTGEGTPPCAFTVSSVNGGNVILTDSTGQQYFRGLPAPTSAATTVSAPASHRLHAGHCDLLTWQWPSASDG